MVSDSSEPVGLHGLFDAGVFTAEVRLHDELDALFPEEHAALTQARPERIREFQAGRHAARRALSELGVSPTPIPRRADRSPLWPPGIAGSITHVRREGVAWAAAAVARTELWPAIGVDAEVDAPLEVALWRRVLTPAERARIEAEPAEVRGGLAKLVFSAKESVYKCQYALTRTFLEFADVEVDLREGAFVARFGPPAVARTVGETVEGRWIRRGGLIVTAAALRAPRP
jgi:4'-phosphopantetheinyl transferase EntD